MLGPSFPSGPSPALSLLYSGPKHVFLNLRLWVSLRIPAIEKDNLISASDHLYLHFFVHEQTRCILLLFLCFLSNKTRFKKIFGVALF